MLLDELVPTYEFSERHETVVSAPPEQVMRAINELAPADIPLFRELFAVRNLPQRFTGKKSEFDRSAPLLGQMLTHGFTKLGEDPGKELVFGVIGQFWKIKVEFEQHAANREEFLAFDKPEYGKAVMNFHLSPAPGSTGTLLTTETRIHIADPASRRKFGRYWRLAGWGSALVRRLWLRAIKRRAEG